jgi:hypothetical protein
VTFLVGGIAVMGLVSAVHSSLVSHRFRRQLID